MSKKTEPIFYRENIPGKLTIGFRRSSMPELNFGTYTPFRTEDIIFNITPGGYEPVVDVKKIIDKINELWMKQGD